MSSMSEEAAIEAAAASVRQTSESTPRAPADEAEIVRQVQRGDRAAFDTLARRYAQRAFEIAYRVLGHRQDAEDLVQEAFMAALDGIQTFDAVRPFGPWFARIVFNRGLNARRSRSSREGHVRVAELRDDDGQSDAANVSVERSEIMDAFTTALGMLPEQQRLIVQLSDVDGRTSSEIGTLLDMPDGTVRWHLHQARKVLRQALEPLRRRDDE
jgi:RNA polymerase sigma-70 factor (ECF subfamily)